MTQSVFPVAEYLLWLDVEHGGDGISNMKLQKSMLPSRRISSEAVIR